MTANDVLFGGGGAPAVQWQNPATKQDYPIGTSYEGVITRLDSTQQRNIQDKSKLDFWPDGSPKMVALVTIQTDLRDPQIDGDDGQRTVWVSGKYLTDAIRTAVRKAGAGKLDEGGWLKVTLTGYGEASNGFRAPRLFTAEYRKPQPDANAANATLGMAAQQSAPSTDLSGGPGNGVSAVQPAQGGVVTGGQTVDLSNASPEARAMVEKLLAAQQGGPQ